MRKKHDASEIEKKYAARTDGESWFVSGYSKYGGGELLTVKDQETAEAAAAILNGEDEVEKTHAMVGRVGACWGETKPLTIDQYNRIMAIANEKPEPAPTLQERMGVPLQLNETGALCDCDWIQLSESKKLDVLDIVNTVVGKLLNAKGQGFVGLRTVPDELNALGRRLMEDGSD